MWYDKGKCKVKNLQVCFYDMEHGAKCFDESFYSPKNSIFALEHIETIEEENWVDRRRVFVNMNNGDVYELSMRKLTEEQVKECGNFYGGK